MRTFGDFKTFTLFCFALVATAAATPVYADGTLTLENGETREVLTNSKARKYALNACPTTDPSCNLSLLRLVTGFTGKFETGMGCPTCGAKGKGLAPGVTVIPFALQSPSADLAIGKFEATYVPHATGETADGVRLRFTLANADVLFFCKDVVSKEIHAPAASLMKYKCAPTESIGLGGRLTEMQWDPKTGRFGGRWATFNGVLNLFGNGNGTAYLFKHADAVLGASAETMHADKETVASLRGVLGMQGLVRSDDSKFQASGEFFYRPILAGGKGFFKDFALEGKAKLEANIPMGETLVLSPGIEGSASHWTAPSESFGTHTSAISRTSAYAGITLGVTYDYLGR